MPSLRNRKKGVGLLYYLIIFVLIVVAVAAPVFVSYYVFTGKGEHLSVGWFLENSSPYFWSSIGIFVSVSLSVTGAALGVYTAATSIIGCGTSVPRVTLRNMISIIFCEAVAVNGVIAAIGLTNLQEEYDQYSLTNELRGKIWMRGYVLFGAGITVGIANLCSGVALGIVGSCTAIADAANPNNPAVFVKFIVIEAFASFISVQGFVGAFYMISMTKMVNETTIAH